MSCFHIGNTPVGDKNPCFLIAEAGQNHNGDIEIAKRMIYAAKAAGASAIKFQKRDLELAIPEEQKQVQRDTPWGRMSYIDYRRKLEFGMMEFSVIHDTCRNAGIKWFSSVWDKPSLDMVMQFNPPAIKIPSACLTDSFLLKAAIATGKPVLLSTGMSTGSEIVHAANILTYGAMPAAILHCRSKYPSEPKILNLRAIESLTAMYGHSMVIGYSGHEVGLWTSLMAVVLGAKILERHFTLDRSMWGTDQPASVEPSGFAKLAHQIARWEEAAGTGILGMDPAEEETRKKLRRIP